MDRRVRTHGKSARYACNSDSAKRSQRRGRSALWAEKTRTPNRQGVLRGSWTGAGSSRCRCAWGSQVTLTRPRKTWGEPPRDLCSRHSPVAASWHFGSTRLTLAAKRPRAGSLALPRACPSPTSSQNRSTTLLPAHEGRLTSPLTTPSPSACSAAKARWLDLETSFFFFFNIHL